MTKAEFRQHLVSLQNGIAHESNEDTWAWEYHAEIQSVIDCIDKGGTEKEIQAACDWVGQRCYL